MNYGYYPGCSLEGTAKEFDLSIKECCRSMGLDLVEVPDWNCCGATSAHQASDELTLALAVRVLSQAERNNLSPVLVPCVSCYSRLKLANQEVSKDQKLLSRMSEIIGQDYSGKVEVKHITEVLIDNAKALESSVVRPLKGIKVASYYGCVLVRPPGLIDFDDAENPVSMDNITAALGAEPVDWSHKTECCGASFTFSKTDIAVRLVGDVLEAAQLAGADVITVACPLCQANLDMRQSMSEKRNKTKYDIPILYITQLAGLAQGKDYRSLGLQKHVVSPGKLFERITAAPQSPEAPEISEADKDSSKED